MPLDAPVINAVSMLLAYQAAADSSIDGAFADMESPVTFWRMKIGICSFSFHRLYAAGQHDIFRFITDCKNLGCTQLDPWNAHLSVARDGEAVITAGHNPHMAHHHFSAADEQYIQRVKSAADAAGLPFGTIAVDGAHIYEADASARQANRQRAYRWLDIAHKLGARQIRIDAG